MKSMQPKIGDTLWGVWEHRYYNEKRLVELEYVVYPSRLPDSLRENMSMRIASVWMWMVTLLFIGLQ